MIIFMPFERQLDRLEFACGVDVLDDWFHRHCGQQERSDTSRTFFGVDEAEARIASYYSLTAFQLEPGAGVAAGFGDRYPVPTVLLGRLAVDTRYQGSGLGKLTLVHALRTVRDLSDSIGFRCVVVDAIDERAAGFYRRFGFKQLSDGGLRLFLTTAAVRASFAAGESS